MTIEYRVKPITRYIVTRHEELSEQDALMRGQQAGSRQIGGEHDNAEVAYQVGYALARFEAENLGYGPDDMRLIYPQHPREQFARAVGADGQLLDLMGFGPDGR